MKVYRVLYHLASALTNEPGGVFFIPPQGAGRIDNPAEYQTLYVGDSPAGACAEVFNRGKYRLEWTGDMLRGFPGLPTSERVLVWYELSGAAKLCDLDNPKELLPRKLRPSQVIARDYVRSQAWAAKIFDEGRWDGLRWWSFHDSRWASIGIWNLGAVDGHGVEKLSLDHPAIVEAADVLSIRIRRR